MKPVFALLLSCLAFTVSAQRIIDVLHYRFEVDLNDNNDTVKGRATLTYKLLENVPLFDINLKKADNKNGMTVLKVIYPESSPSDIIGPGNMVQHEGNRLTLRNIQGRKGDTSSLIIEYKGIPANGLIISKNQFGKRTFFGDNWPNRAHHWLPCVDDPADKASVEFIVTAPLHYQVVANGIQIEETNLPGNKKLTHWKEDVPLPTKVMVIGVAGFAVQNVGSADNCIPVSSWVFPENKTEGFYDYATAKDVLAWHINYIGPYAYKKLANVQSKTMFGGMENAGAIFYHEGSVTGKRMEEELQSHEIVHQWFGNHATEKSFAHLWLSEGFATYLTHIYMESKYGTDSLNKRMKADRETVLDFVKTSKRPVVDTTPDFMKLLNPNSYQKGSWVLHMLRRQLGNAVFHKSIRDYYSNYGGKNADTRDLQKIFETNSGKKLDQFFQQWLYTPENLQLNISWKYNKKEKNVAVTVKQLQSSGSFQFPFELLIRESLDSMPKRMIKTVTKRTETFLFPVRSKPISVEADPATSLLYEGNTSEIK